MSAGQNYAELAPFRFETGVGVELAQYLFVTVDPVTGLVSTGITDTPSGYTVQPADVESATAQGVVSVGLMADKTVMGYVKTGIAVTKGDELSSDANGLAIAVVVSSGIYARRTVQAGGIVPVYSM